MVKPGIKENLLRQIIRPLSIIIPLAIAGNFIYIIVGTRPEILFKIPAVKIQYFIIALFMAFIPWFTHSFRTMLWARVFSRKLSFSQGIKVAMATEIGSAVTPTSTGGGYIKLAMLSAYGFGAGQAALVTLLGSIEDAVFFIIAIPLAVYFSNSWSNPNLRASMNNLVNKWPWLAGFAAAIILIYLLLYLWRKYHNKIPETHENRGWIMRISNSFAGFWAEFRQTLKFVSANGKSAFIRCTILTGIGWCCRYGAITAIALGLGLKADPILFFLFQWVVFTTMTVVPTPGAIGGAEASFALIYGGIFPSGLLPIITGIWRLITFYLLVAAGGVILSLMGLDLSGRDKARLLEENDK
jgi:glycosyltransferase 2 family protein